MATVDQIVSVHKNISILVGTGSALSLVSMASYFMSYEYKDFDRVEVNGHYKMEETLKKRRSTSKIIMACAIIGFIAGLALITVGICLYRNEREEQATAIPTLVQQIRNKNAQPDLNEPAILAGISSCITLIGVVQCARQFDKTEQFGWVGSLLYAVGWIGNGFSAAMNNKSVNSLVGMRLAWTLPGIVGIVAGTFIIPWQLHNTYISGPGWPIAALGYVAFTVGTSYVTDPPQLIN